MLKTDDYTKAMNAILESSKHCSDKGERWQENAEEHLKKAQIHAKSHERYLMGCAGIKESSKFIKGFNDHVNRIKQWINSNASKLKKNEEDSDEKEFHAQLARIHYNAALDYLGSAYDHAIRGRVHAPSGVQAKEYLNQALHHISHFTHHSDRIGFDHHAHSRAMLDAAAHINWIMNPSIKKSESLKKIGGFPSLPPLDSNVKQNTNKPWKVSKPKVSSEHDYVPLAHLHPEDVNLAHQQYGSKDMGKHLYPVDKTTKRFVRGTSRKPIPNGDSAPQPKAAPSSYSKEVVAGKPMPGQSVRIDSPGHEHHGKLGIVRQTNPYYPNKITVQVGHKEHQVDFFDVGQIKPSASLKKHLDLDNIRNKVVYLKNRVTYDKKKNS